MNSEHNTTSTARTPESLREKVFATIEHGHLSPKPRWHFLLREGMVWGVAGLSFVVGTIATALTIYIMNTSRHVEMSILFSDVRYVFALVPFVWVGICIAGLFYTVHAIHETRRGYAWNTRWLVVGAIMGSVIFGTLIHGAGLGERLDTYFLRTVPLYKPLSGFSPNVWMNESDGVFAGVVLHIEEDGFTLRTVDEQTVRVLVTMRTHFSPRLRLEEGVMIKVFSVPNATTTAYDVVAERITPFMGRGRMLHVPSEGLEASSARFFMQRKEQRRDE